MFCAVPPNDVRVQEQCITAIMMRANVQHLDPAGPRVGNGKNMLVEKGDNGRASRITLFDFDISSIDGFKGRGIKPAIGQLPDARKQRHQDRRATLPAV